MPPKPPAALGGPSPPHTGGQGSPDPLRASAHGTNGEEHEIIMARNVMSNHTDMQDQYCGHSNDVNPIQSQHKGGGRGTSSVVSFVLALNRVNVIAVTTILVLHVGVIGHHVPCHYDLMFPHRSYHARLRARGVQGSLPPRRGLRGSLCFPPEGSKGVRAAARPPIV